MITQVENRKPRAMTFCGICGKRFRWYAPAFSHFFLQAIWGCNVHQRDREIGFKIKRGMLR